MGGIIWSFDVFRFLWGGVGKIFLLHALNRYESTPRETPHRQWWTTTGRYRCRHFPAGVDQHLRFRHGYPFVLASGHFHGIQHQLAAEAVKEVWLDFRTVGDGHE